MTKIQLTNSYEEQEGAPFFSNFKEHYGSDKKEFASRIPPIDLYTVSSAYVSPYGVVFKNGKIVSESLYPHPGFSKLKTTLSFFKKIISRKVQELPEECFVCHHAWHFNYYHWIVEILPRFFISREYIKNSTLLLHENVTVFQKQSVELFGLKNVKFIKDHELMRVSKILFPSFVNFASTTPVSFSGKEFTQIDVKIHKPVVKGMAEWIRSNHLNVKNEKRKIFISRQKAQYRKLLNYDEVKKVLNSFEIEEVFLEELSFIDQLNLLANTQITIGLHGAGMSNIFVMPEGSYVLNFIHKDHHEYCYQQLAHAVDLNYAHVCSEGNSHPNPAYNDIKIDIELLKKLLEKITKE